MAAPIYFTSLSQSQGALTSHCSSIARAILAHSDPLLWFVTAGRARVRKRVDASLSIDLAGNKSAPGLSKRVRVAVARAGKSHSRIGWYGRVDLSLALTFSGAENSHL